MSIDISGIELYKYLGLAKYASDPEIKKAYKKLALKLHPDRNLDNSKAVEQFQLLQKVFEALTDGSRKVKYDQKLKAQDETEKRMKVSLKELDEQTIRFRRMFDEKEREYLSKKQEKEREEREKQNLIERLREEGRKKMKEEDEKWVREQEKILQEKLIKENPPEPEGYNVKVAWKALKKEPIQAYSADDLRILFSKYGDVLEVVKSGKKEGLYLIQFLFKEQAVMSMEEKGHSANPLAVSPMFKLEIPEASVPKKYPNRNQNSPTPSNDSSDPTPTNDSSHVKSFSSGAEKTVKYVSKEDFEALYSCCLVSEMRSGVTLVEDNEIITDSCIIRPITLRPRTAYGVTLNRDYESFMERTLRQKAERERLNREIMEEDD